MEFQKGIKMNQSPNSVLPALHNFPDCEKTQKRNPKPKPNCRDEILRVKEGFTEISFRRYRSSSCKNFPSRTFDQGNTVELRRGSVYQSSKEIRDIRRPGNFEGRTKIELSRSSDASFSFRIVDSSKDESKDKRLNIDLSSSSGKSCLKPHPSDKFIEICLNSGIKDRAVELDSNEDPNSRCNEVAGPLNECNDCAMRLPKSHSAKVDMPNSPSSSETDHSTRENSRGQFGHIRKIFDPFVKSKSLRSPLGYIGESGEFKVNGKENASKDKKFCKSFLNEFSGMCQNSEPCCLTVKKDHSLAVKSSPVHLHGHLKLEKERNKHGLPVFEFSLDFPEEVYISKTWRSNNNSSWVYTFHSTGSRKKSNASAWSLNDTSSRESSTVGQMQVSGYICSELKKDGTDLGDSMVTEFVLFDIAHARRSGVSVQENLTQPRDMAKLSELSDGSDSVKHTNQPKQNGDFDAMSEPNLWAATDLHPDLEIAAIIVQDPIEKRESLKYKRGDRITQKSNLLCLPITEEGKKDRSPEKLKVVIPTGNHGLPNAENCGPSPLLQRWRLGGGCDCGGWDMACPLIIFGNPSIHCGDDHPLVDNYHPLELFFQGAKDSTPALSMAFVEEGHYSIDFHAQLSTLQAFSICVAILHNTEASVLPKNEGNMQFSQCNSLKTMIDDEVKLLVEAVTEEEKKKVVKKAVPSYIPNPPFSPIARV